MTSSGAEALRSPGAGSRMIVWTVRGEDPGLAHRQLPSGCRRIGKQRVRGRPAGVSAGMALPRFSPTSSSSRLHPPAIPKTPLGTPMGVNRDIARPQLQKTSHRSPSPPACRVSQAGAPRQPWIRTLSIACCAATASRQTNCRPPRRRELFKNIAHFHAGAAEEHCARLRVHPAPPL